MLLEDQLKVLQDYYTHLGDKKFEDMNEFTNFH